MTRRIFQALPTQTDTTTVAFIYKMDEMSIRLDDGTNFGEAFFLLAIVRLD